MDQGLPSIPGGFFGGEGHGGRKGGEGYLQPIFNHAEMSRFENDKGQTFIVPPPLPSSAYVSMQEAVAQEVAAGRLDPKISNNARGELNYAHVIPPVPRHQPAPSGAASARCGTKRTRSRDTAATKDGKKRQAAGAGRGRGRGVGRGGGGRQAGVAEDCGKGAGEVGRRETAGSRRGGARTRGGTGGKRGGGGAKGGRPRIYEDEDEEGGGGGLGEVCPGSADASEVGSSSNMFNVDDDLEGNCVCPYCNIPERCDAAHYCPICRKFQHSLCPSLEALASAGLPPRPEDDSKNEAAEQYEGHGKGRECIPCRMVTGARKGKDHTMDKLVVGDAEKEQERRSEGLLMMEGEELDMSDGEEEEPDPEDVRADPPNFWRGHTGFEQDYGELPGDENEAQEILAGRSARTAQVLTRPSNTSRNYIPKAREILAWLKQQGYSPPHINGQRLLRFIKETQVPRSARKGGGTPGSRGIKKRSGGAKRKSTKKLSTTKTKPRDYTALMALDLTAKKTTNSMMRGALEAAGETIRGNKADLVKRIDEIRVARAALPTADSAMNAVASAVGDAVDGGGYDDEEAGHFNASMVEGDQGGDGGDNDEEEEEGLDGADKGGLNDEVDQEKIRRMSREDPPEDSNSVDHSGLNFPANPLALSTFRGYIFGGRDLWVQQQTPFEWSEPNKFDNPNDDRVRHFVNKTLKRALNKRKAEQLLDVGLESMVNSINTETLVSLARYIQQKLKDRLLFEYVDYEGNAPPVKVVVAMYKVSKRN
ncbi:hypothetical protein HK101_005097, partial [Irineochytrium annulatum]